MDEYKKFWNEMASVEEEDLDDEKINRLLRWIEVKSHLEGVKNILDIGGGTGAFSITLAKMGYHVTHLDISEEMLRKAENKAQGIEHITFMLGDAKHLSAFEENQFDLVLNFDGAISFSGRDANRVISETCRVGKKVILSVSNKACMTATWLNYSIEKLHRIHPSVRAMMESGYWNAEDYEDGQTLTAIKALKAYDVKELKEVLESNDMKVLACRSIGSLTHLYLMHLYRQFEPEKVLERITEISKDETFLKLCNDFDHQVMDTGMGSFRRGGLLAVAEKK